MDIQCICGNKYDKKEFKKHFKNCCKFIEKFKDFDFKISQLIKKYYKVKHAIIIQFLLQRYIKIIEHKIRKYQEDNSDFNIRKIQSYEKKNKNIENETKLINPFYVIDDIIKYNKNNLNINNNNLINYYNINNNMNNNINNKINNNFNNDENLLNIKCTVKPKKFKNTNILKEMINSINLKNKDNNFIKCNEINFKLLNNKDKEKKMENKFLKNLSFIADIQPEIVSDFKKIDYKNCIPYLSFLGSNIKGENIILDYCKSIYINNNGIINNDIAKSISLFCKDIFSGEWLTIITSIDYIDIYYNISSLKCNDKNIIFFLDNKKFYIIGC